ncbi:MAG: hypothetical protein EXR76_02195 [Myxococcales bacterium]|nr:hypothetical protein [Myxococcales bacterium]
MSKTGPRPEPSVTDRVRGGESSAVSIWLPAPLGAAKREPGLQRRSVSLGEASEHRPRGRAPRRSSPGGLELGLCHADEARRRTARRGHPGLRLFRGLRRRGADLRGCDLSGADLRLALLIGTAFSDVAGEDCLFDRRSAWLRLVEPVPEHIDVPISREHDLLDGERRGVDVLRRNHIRPVAPPVTLVVAPALEQLRQTLAVDMHLSLEVAVHIIHPPDDHEILVRREVLDGELAVATLVRDAHVFDQGAVRVPQLLAGPVGVLRALDGELVVLLRGLVEDVDHVDEPPLLALDDEGRGELL